MLTNLKWKIILGYAAFCVVFIGTIIFCWIWNNRQMDDINTLYYDDMVSTTAKDMLLNLQQAESSRRGYVITKDTSYVRAYYESVKKVERALASFRNLNNVRQYQDTFIDSLRLIIDLKIMTVRFSIEALMEKRSSDSLQIAFTRTGHETMTSIRSIIEEMASEKQRDSRDQRNSLIQTASILDNWLLISAILICAVFATFCLVTILYVRNIERRSEKLEGEFPQAYVQLMNLLSRSEQSTRKNPPE
jgi:CHASE3 domain sensor protein